MGMPQRCLRVRHRCMAEEESCKSTSGLELIFQIYLSGNGLEPTEPLQMALGELEWMKVSKPAAVYYHLSRCCLCLFIFIHFFFFPFMCVHLCVIVKD